MQTPAAAAAKDFFLAALEEQAARDLVPLSELERQMFVFSEASAPRDDVDPLKFDADQDEQAYEAKIAKLLKRAYRRDRDDPSRADLWKQSLRALKGEDFYGMVMMEQAGLPVPDLGFDLVRTIVDLAPLAATVLAFIVPFVLLCLDPFHWNLVPDGWPRVVLFIVLGIGAWVTIIVIPERRLRSRPW